MVYLYLCLCMHLTVWGGFVPSCPLTCFSNAFQSWAHIIFLSLRHASLRHASCCFYRCASCITTVFFHCLFASPVTSNYFSNSFFKNISALWGTLLMSPRVKRGFTVPFPSCRASDTSACHLPLHLVKMAPDWTAFSGASSHWSIQPLPVFAC